MEKLSKEELQFIDNYLDNSDIIYADIRMEIIDHVASEIENRMQANNEATFYTIFKTYMVENKADLLKDNKKYIKSIENKNTKFIIKELLSFKALIVFVLLLFLSNNYLLNFKIMSPKHIFTIPFLLIIITTIIYFISFKIYKYSRFSGVERLGFLYYVLFQVFYFISMFIRNRIEDLNNVLVSALFALCITLIYVFVKVTITVIKTYRTQYKSIV